MIADAMAAAVAMTQGRSARGGIVVVGGARRRRAPGHSATAPPRMAHRQWPRGSESGTGQGHAGLRPRLGELPLHLLGLTHLALRLEGKGKAARTVARGNHAIHLQVCNPDPVTDPVT